MAKTTGEGIKSSTVAKATYSAKYL